MIGDVYTDTAAPFTVQFIQIENMHLPRLASARRFKKYNTAPTSTNVPKNVKITAIAIEPAP